MKLWIVRASRFSLPHVAHARGMAIGKLPAQRAFMCPIRLVRALKDEAGKRASMFLDRLGGLAEEARAPFSAARLRV